MIIYKTTCIINFKSYVGKDNNDNDKYYGSGLLLKKAINKYGIENFRKDILEFCLTKEELNKREKFWIKLLKTQNRKFGYNIADGGNGGFTGYHSEEIKIKCGIKNIGNKYRLNKKHSNKTKLKISKSKIGIKLGPMSEEHKEKLKIPKSKEWKLKITGKKRTLEQRKNISDGMKGKKRGPYKKK